MSKESDDTKIMLVYLTLWLGSISTWGYQTFRWLSEGVWPPVSITALSGAQFHRGDWQGVRYIANQIMDTNLGIVFVGLTLLWGWLIKE